MSQLFASGVCVKLLSRVRLFAIPWTVARQAPLSMDSPGKNTGVGCHFLFQGIFPTQVSNLGLLHCRRTLYPLSHQGSHLVAKELEFQLQHQSFQCIFRTDFLSFVLPAVQGTLKSLLQHHSSKASILWHSAFFIVQLSNPYMTTGKTIVLTRWTFVGKVMSLLLNTLSRLVITFLPRSKRLLT